PVEPHGRPAPRKDRWRQSVERMDARVGDDVAATCLELRKPSPDQKHAPAVGPRTSIIHGGPGPSPASVRPRCFRAFNNLARATGRVLTVADTSSCGPRVHRLGGTVLWCGNCHVQRLAWRTERTRRPPRA